LESKEGCGLGEYQHVLMGHQVDWLAADARPAGLGELPERWPGHQLPVPDGGVQRDEVLEIA
jgi:hypothetical protein